MVDGSLSPCIGAQRKRAPPAFESSCPLSTMPATAKRRQPSSGTSEDALPAAPLRSFPQQWRPMRLVQRERREETGELWRRLDDLVTDLSNPPSPIEPCAFLNPIPTPIASSTGSTRPEWGKPPCLIFCSLQASGRLQEAKVEVLAMLDLLREIQAAPQEIRSMCKHVACGASQHLKILDPVPGDEELIKAVAVELNRG